MMKSALKVTGWRRPLNAQEYYAHMKGVEWLYHS